MSSVKLTFEKSGDGSRIVIEKVGDKFTLDEMSKVTSTVDAMFAGAMLEGAPDARHEDEEDVEDVDDEEVDKSQAEEENEEIIEEAEEQGKDIDTTRKTKDGTIDQRQLNRGQGRAGGETKSEHEARKRKDGGPDKRSQRAERTPEQLKDEPFIKRLQQDTPEAKR